MTLELVKERPLDREHHLYAIADRGKRPRPTDALLVVCSCGRRLAHSIFGQYQAALDLSARNHKRDLA